MKNKANRINNSIVEKNNCPTVLIADDPVLDDHLGGAHERVAMAIYNLVLNENGGKSIGLEGDYGSGKTTVIRILENKLSKNDNCKLILFDAWAHEGDPLRRAFLENTINTLLSFKTFINEKVWSDKLDELAQKKEIKSTKTIPHLTSLGKVVGVSILLIPVGIGILNAALRNENLTLFDFDKSISRKFLVGLVLSLMPLWVVFIAWLISNIKQLFNYFFKSKEKAFEQGKDESDSIFALLFNKAITEEKTETSKTPNPTALEFESYFKDLMSEALNGSKKRLVLVFDNLDRVEPDMALSIWSTLQTFVEHARNQQLKWTSRFWILVLFDPKALRSHWGEEKKDSIKLPEEIPEPEKEEPIKNSEAVPELKADTKNTLHQNVMGVPKSKEFSAFTSFIDKTFQIRFRVPAPLLSRWREQLLNLLQEAFPAHNENHDIKEFHQVYRVFETYFSTLQQIPTIRKLKLFVNQIGVVHRQWADQFPLSHIAYFTLFQHEIENHTSWFLDHPQIEYKGIFSNEHELVDNLVSIAFNVETETARELILSPQIKNALIEGNINSLISLSGYGTGFWQILEKLFTNDKDWIVDDESKISNTAFCFFESGLFENVNEEMTSTVKSALSNIASKVEFWYPLDIQMAKGLAGICSWAESAEIQKNVLQAIIFGVSESNKNKRNKDIFSFAEGLLFIEKYLASSGFYDVYSEIIIKGIFEKLRTRRKDGFITKRSHPYGHELKALLVTLFELGEKNKDARELNIKLAEEGIYLTYISHTLSQLNVGNEYGRHGTDIIAWCLFLTLKNLPDALVNPLFANLPSELDALRQIFSFERQNKDKASTANQRFDAIPKSFTSILTGYNQAHLLFDVLEKEPTAEPFIARCVVTLFKERETKYLFPSNLILKYWQFIESNAIDKGLIYDSEVNAFMDFYGLTDEIIQKLLLSKFDERLLLLYKILIGANGPKFINDFYKWIQEGINNLSIKQWTNALLGKNKILTFVFQFSDMFQDFQIGRNYLDALILVYKEVISGNINTHLPPIPNDVLSSGQGYYENLLGKYRNEFQEKLWNLVLDAKGNIDQNAYISINAELTNLDNFPKNGDFFHNIYLPLLKSEGFWLDWILKVLASKSDITNIPDFNQKTFSLNIKEITKELLRSLNPNSLEFKYLNQINEYNE